SHREACHVRRGDHPPGKSGGGLHGANPRCGGIPRCPGCRGSGAMTTVRPYRSSAPARRGGFAQLLYAEWTQFRTVRGWGTGIIAPVLVIVGVRPVAARGGRKA